MSLDLKTNATEADFLAMMENGGLERTSDTTAHLERDCPGGLALVTLMWDPLAAVISCHAVDAMIGPAPVRFRDWTMNEARVLFGITA